jgi:hypothetical protein
VKAQGLKIIYLNSNPTWAKGQNILKDISNALLDGISLEILCIKAQRQHILQHHRLKPKKKNFKIIKMIELTTIIKHPKNPKNL